MNVPTPTGRSARSVIHVDGLRVRYGDTDVVDGISFDVHAGEVLALLGPNGAGKTTTVEVLEGHRRRTAGTVDVLGFDPQRGRRAFRERIGIVLQEAGLDRRCSPASLNGRSAGVKSCVSSRSVDQPSKRCCSI